MRKLSPGGSERPDAEAHAPGVGPHPVGAGGSSMNTAGVVATAPENDAALRASGFLLLMASVFTVSMGHGAVLPLLPFFLERLPGDTACCAVSWHTGMLTGVYMFALFVFAPLWGRLSDRGGRRPVILLGLGGFILASILFGFSRTLWLSYLARALAGTFAAAVLPVSSAYVGDTSSPEKRARRFGWISAATILGFLAGPALAGLVSSMEMPSNAMLRDRMLLGPFLAVAGLGAVVWAAVYLRLPEPIATGLRPAPGTRPMVSLLALSLLTMFGIGSFEVAFTLQGQQTLRLDPFRIGLVFMECSLVMVVIQALVFSPLVKRVGDRAVIVPALLAMAAGLGLLPTQGSFGGLLLLVGLVSAGSAILIPMLAYRVSLDAGAGQGAALGKETAAASLGQALGSTAAGLLFAVTAPAPFWLTASLLLVGALIGLGIGRGTVAAPDGSGKGRTGRKEEIHATLTDR